MSADFTRRLQSSPYSMRTLTGYMALAAFVCVCFADIEIISPDPFFELKAMSEGLLNPRIDNVKEVLFSVANTLSFALQGMGLAVFFGFLLALFYQLWWVRAFCAFIRAIHELFFALIFIQVFGLSPLSGLLAIGLPYAGTLAKVYGELFEEVQTDPRNNLLHKKGFSAFLYTTFFQSWPTLVHYTRYRFECALRSTVVLGFVGLPTLGFHLESTLKQGQYAESAGLIYILLLLISSQKLWLRKQLLPVLLFVSVLYLPPTANVSWSTVSHFFGTDIIPLPFRDGLVSAPSLFEYSHTLWHEELKPGVINTVILSQVALFLSAFLALLLFPLTSARFFNGAFNKLVRGGGKTLLLVGRTLPEYLLAFIALLLWGPSMLPAFVALALHNGTILAHLLAQISGTFVLREDATQGVNRYFYEVLPRIYRQFLALLFYRWEIIMRESAILGILGVTTLGFYIDSAFEAFRFDRAVLLILASAFLNMGVDALARFLRRNLHVQTAVD